MATSGIISGWTSNISINCEVRWKVLDQNKTENTTRLELSLYYWREDDRQTYGTWDGAIIANGVSIAGTKKIIISDEVQAVSGYLTIAHNADGSKTVAVSANGVMYGTTLESTTLSGSIKLPDIPRPATLTKAPDFNDEQNPTITYKNKAGTGVTSLQACISFDGSNPDIAYRDISKTGTTYTFNLTEAERKILRKGTTGKSRTVKFYVKTVLHGVTYYSSIAKTLTIINGNPTLSPTVKDTYAATIALTGNADRMVKYFSNAEFTTGAKAIKEATLKSQKVICGGKSSTAASGTLTKVESGNFEFTATDSRGFTTKRTVKKTIVEYVKLTCNITPSTPTANGDMTLTIKGNYFNGSFGAVANVLTLRYRQKTNNDAFGDWIDATPTLSGNTYSVSIPFSGLDYQSKYTFQAKVFDKLMSVETPQKSVKATPVFDWGANDFKFNVPVYESSGLCLSGAAKALTNTYALATTYTPASGYTAFSGSNAVLMGSNLRCHFSATRSAATGAGNIANEVMGTLKIKHSGKIKSTYRINFTSGATGHIATFQTFNEDNDGEYLTFDLQIMATHAAGSEFSGYFIVPCMLNLDKY